MTLEDDVATLAKLQAGQRAYKKNADKVRKRILKELSVGEHRVGRFHVKIEKDEYRQLDRERLEAALGERFEEYVKATTRWSVKSNEVGEDG